MIEQLREHLKRRPFEPFGIELSTGRFLNVYEPGEMALTSFADPGAVAVAQDGAFVIVSPAHIVSIGPPRNPVWPGSRKAKASDPETPNR